MSVSGNSSQAGTEMSKGTLSSQAAHRRRYHGLLKRSPLKNIRDDIFRFLDYIGTMAPAHRSGMNFMMYYTCTVLLIMGCIPQSAKYWDRSNLVGVLMNIISVFAFVSPASLAQTTFLIVAIVVEGLCLVSMVITLMCFFMFLRMSKFPIALVSLVSWLLNGFIPLEVVVLSGYGGRAIAGLAKGDGSMAANAVCLVLAVIVIAVMTFVQRYFVTPSLAFRPQAVMFVLGKHMMWFLLFVCLYSALLSMGGRMDDTVGGVLVYIGVAVMALTIGLMELFKYAMSSHEKTAVIIGYVSASAICAVIFQTMDFAGVKGTEASLVVALVVFLVCYLLSRKMTDLVLKKMAAVVEQATNDNEFFDSLPYAKALLVARLSFEWGYPTAHRWILFEHLHRRFPDDPNNNIMFARYAAIYSDETATLKIAGRRVMDAKHGNLEMKRVLFEIFSVLQQREASMSATIKKAISKISAKIEKARGQIRYLWECIIRGNLDELEGLSVHLKGLQAEIVRDYNQLCLIYPNNPYVAHSYASFLSEMANDETGAAEMRFTYQMLRMGKRTRVERCYFFGTRFLPRLPSDDQHTALTRADAQNNHAVMPAAEPSISLQSSQQADLAIDPNDAENDEKVQRRYVENMIESVRIPSMQYGPFFIIFVIVLLMPICIIPITVSVIGNIHMVQDAMEVVKYTSLMRFQFTELVLLTYQESFSRTQVTHMITLKERWALTYGRYYPLPANWSTDEEAQRASLMKARSLVNEVNVRAPSLAKYSVFSESLEVLYSPILDWDIYASHNDWHTYQFSLEYISVYMMSVAVKATTNDDPLDFLDKMEMWTMVKGTKNWLLHTQTFGEKVLSGIRLLTTNTENDVMLQVLLAILLPYVVAVCFNIFLILRLEKEKRRIFSSFKALPKSALSAIVQNLNAQSHKGSDDEEKIAASAQEENALRVLSTSVDHGFGWIGRSWQILALLFLFTVGAIAAIVILVVFTKQIGATYDRVNPLFMDAPRLNTLFEAMTLSLLRMTAIGEFPADNSTWKLPANAKANFTLVMQDLEYFMDMVTDTINNFRIANPWSNATGLSVGGKEFIALLTQPSCKKESFEFGSMLDVLFCTSFETSAAFLLQRMWQVYYLIYLQESDDYDLPFGTLRFDIEMMNILMCWLLGVSRDEFLDPAMAFLEKLVDREVSKTVNQYIAIPVIVCTLVIMAVGICLVPNFLRIAEGARWSLRLLLFCQPNIVLQSKPILKILSNDFSDNDEQKDQSGVDFYETVVSNLLDGVLFLSNTLEILSANQAVESVLGVDPKGIIGKQLNDIFKAPEDHDSSLKAFFAAIQGALKCQRSPSIEAEAEVLRDGDCITLGLSLTAVASSGIVQTKATNAEGLAVLALVMKDMTSTIASNKLLVEEGIKSEKLLLMILPPIIVDKLQSGEKNISFAVKSASIMFVDIVSFTPWCGSHPAAYVMATLNRLFLEFDRILKKYDRMTKIKCIGDCYMCAGGIFDEINQPAEHTKQTISFGIDIIKALQLLNIELGETLRIRVGVNTGGPIVAGVLGIDKPTFDILGPDICLAAMMEHHGVPMHVHIPQHCYELVYGSLFRIKERGDVEVKGKMYHTYVVSGYDQKE